MNRFSRKFRVAALALLAAVVSAGPALASVSMSWPEYAREILLNNQSLQAGIKNVEAAYYSVLSSVATQHPRAAIIGTGNWLSSMQGRDNVTTGSLAIAATHQFDLSGKYSLDERQNILGYEVTRAQFDTSLNNLLAAAEETWWSTVLARENIKLQREILKQRSENHRITMEKYRQELVPKLDIVRSEARVVEAETLVKSAETTYRNLLASLSYFAGGLDVEPIEEDELKVPDFDINFDFGDALRYRPDVRAARLSLERAKTIQELRSKGATPTLEIGFQYTAWADPATATTPNNHEAGASLTLTIPLTDGNQGKYNAFNSVRLLQAAAANFEAVQEETRRDITVAMNNWRNASATELDKKRQVERSEEELRITELMYAEGMGAQIDLINAQTDYQAVKTQYLDSVKNMYVALVALRKAIGDYAPDEDGTWTEAVARYGKGNHIVGEVGLKKIRDQRSKLAGDSQPAYVARATERSESDIDTRLRELQDVDTSMTADEIEARLRELDSSR